MNKVLLILLIFIVPVSSWSQKIKKSISTFETYSKDTFIPTDILEETFDKRGRVTKEVYKDVRDSRGRKKEIEYTYKGKKKYLSVETYSSKNKPKIPEPIVFIKQEVIRKKLSKNSYGEKYNTEILTKRPFYFNSNLEDYDSFGIEENNNGIPFDTTLFDVPTKILNKKNFQLITIKKDYSKLPKKVFKAKYEYRASQKKDGYLYLRTATFYEKQEDDTVKRVFASFAPSSKEYYVEGTKILNQRGEVIKELAVKYTYVYDENGNWLTRTKMYNNSPISRTVRQLTY